MENSQNENFHSQENSQGARLDSTTGSRHGRHLFQILNKRCEASAQGSHISCRGS